jgi:ABC-2 type transport system permease protein
MNYIGLYTLVRKEVKRMLRVPGQTILSPLISASLYIFIFGFVIGSTIEEIAGVSYISFVFPGILMLNVISSSFAHTSSSVYFARFIKSIEEILVSPLSYFEIVLGFVIGGIVRALVVATGIVIIGTVFGAVALSNIPLFLFYVIAIATIFSLLGIIVGLWAKGFEQLSSINIFVITPLTYLGGIFYSIHMLPETVRFLTLSNPFFYFVDGLRSTMVGVSEANVTIGLFMILGLVFSLGWLVIHLFHIGWRIRP